MRQADSKRRRIDILTAAEVGRIMAATGRRSALGARDRAMVATLWRSQLRITELLRLTPNDYDGAAYTLRVQVGKGGKYRTVGIDPLACTALDAWLAARPRYAIGYLDAAGVRRESPLFCSRTGRPISRTSWWSALARYARSAGITKRVHPHSLRHTGAAHLRADGVDVVVISAQLGHSNIATTHRYLAHTQPQELIDTIRRREVPADIMRLVASPFVVSKPVDRFAGDPLEFGCS